MLIAEENMLLQCCSKKRSNIASAKVTTLYRKAIYKETNPPEEPDWFSFNIYQAEPKPYRDLQYYSMRSINALNNLLQIIS